MSDPNQGTEPAMQRRHRSTLGLGVAVLATLALVVACGGGSSAKSGSTSGAGTATGAVGGAGTAQQGGGTGVGLAGGSAASGTIAALEASSFEVQNATTGQVTVAYTGATRFTQTVTAKAADITVGSCIVAISATTAGSTTSSSSAATTDSPATSVTVSPATSGSCDRTAVFGGGVRPGGNFGGGSRPSFPSGAPTGTRTFRGGTGAFGNVVSGRVTAVSGDAITVSAIQRTTGFPTAATASPSTAATTAPKTVSKTVTITAATTIRRIASVTKSVLKVGLCATANGTTDSSGAVHATAVALTTPTSAGCTVGFGAGFGGRQGGGLAPSSSANG